MEIKNEKKIKLRIGTRKSKLALIQTNFVIEKLKSIYSNDLIDFEVVGVTTTGDRILDQPLSQVGSKSFFTKELEDLLIQNNVDLIVHSLKDLPTVLPQGLCISSILKREDPNDALVLNKYVENLKISKTYSSFKDTLNSLEDACGKKVTIGTSSLRRIAYLKSLNNKIKVENIRGNLDTRFSKLDSKDSQFTGIILACAGLKRAGFEDRIFQVLNFDKCWYAVGQGALAIECVTSNSKVIEILSPLLDYKTSCECIAERALMFYLKGGCSVPLGVRCSWITNEIKNEDFIKNSDLTLSLSACVHSLDGTQLISSNHQMNLSQEFNDDVKTFSQYLSGFNLPYSESHEQNELRLKFLKSAKLGVELGKILISLGADKILDEIHKEKEKWF